MACVPTHKSNVTPPPPGSGNGEAAGTFGCYDLKCDRTTLPTIPLNDQFGSRSTEPLSSHQLLCAPSIASPTCPPPGNEAGTGCTTLATRTCSSDGGAVLTCGTSGSCSVWQTSEDCRGAGLACSFNTLACECPLRTSTTFYVNTNPTVVAERAAHPRVEQTGVQNPAICSFGSLEVALETALAFTGRGFEGPATVVATGADAASPVLVFPVAQSPVPFATTSPVLVTPGMLLTTSDDPDLGGGGFVPGRYVIELRREPSEGDVDAVVEIDGSTTGGGSLRGFTVRRSATRSANAAAAVRCIGSARVSTAGPARASHVGLEGATVVASGSGGSLVANVTTMTFTAPSGTELTGADTAGTEIVILDAADPANDGVFAVTGVDLEHTTITYTNAGSPDPAFAGRFIVRRPHFDTGIVVDGCTGGFEDLLVSDFMTGFHALGTGSGAADLTDSMFVRNRDAVVVDAGATVNQTNVVVMNDL